MKTFSKLKRPIANGYITHDPLIGNIEEGSGKMIDSFQWLEEEETESCSQHEQFVGPILVGENSFGIL